MDNQKIQEHVQTVRGALQKASTQHEWDTDGRFIEWKDGNPINGTHRRIAITQSLTSEIFNNPNHDNDAYLLSNSPTWHKQSIEIIEQQQREIERLKREYDELEDQAYRWKEESGN